MMSITSDEQSIVLLILKLYFSHGTYLYNCEINTYAPLHPCTTTFDNYLTRVQDMGEHKLLLLPRLPQWKPSMILPHVYIHVYLLCVINLFYCLLLLLLLLY